MQEEDVRDNGRLHCFRRPGSDAVDNACAHEAAVRLGLGAPDGGRKTDESGEEEDWTAAERCADGNPVFDARQRSGSSVWRRGSRTR